MEKELELTKEIKRLYEKDVQRYKELEKKGIESLSLDKRIQDIKLLENIEAFIIANTKK